MDVEPVGAAYVTAAYADGPFGVVVDDRVVLLLDLDPGHVAEIAEAGGIAWVELIATPTANLAAAVALINAAELHADVELSRPTSIVELMRRFVRVTGDGEG
jgi:hypothetical protein